MSSLLPDLPAVFTNDRRQALGFAAFVFGLCGFLWLVSRETNPIGCWVILGFGVLFSIALWWDSHPRRHFLELTEEGFRIASGTRTQFVAWKDVKAFTTTVVNGHPIVVWFYTDEFKLGGLIPRANRPIDDDDGSLPGSFGWQPERLAGLLNEMLGAYGNSSLRNC
jgi:hypothetical protein